MHEYRPGAWVALVSDGSVALLHPAIGARVARELWEIARAGGRLAGWVEHLARGGIRSLPAFAMVEAHPEGLSVLVRGDAAAVVGTREISGTGYATWREEVLPGEDGFRLRGAPGTEGEWLPLVGGVVGAAALRGRAGDGRHAGLRLAGPAADDDVELTLLRSPALAAALGRGQGPARAGLEDTYDPDEDDQPATGAEGPVPAPARPPGRHTAPAPAVISAVPRAGTTTAGEPRVAGPRYEPRPAAAEPVPVLVLPGGERVPVTGPVLLGRAPEAGRFGGDAVPRLVRVPSPGKDVSGTHAEVRPAGRHVVVTDMSSTNGTLLHLPGQQPVRLRPGTGVPVPPGGVIELGAGVRITVAGEEA
ncbi:FHA domain-containing protein [Georgenia sp. AZ-5]|uniref:FHA domain-containing protein n=1 Tax=Georgenia sp. AZ-5 TaxID=3367526 RepID=UPI0037542666